MIRLLLIIAAVWVAIVVFKRLTGKVSDGRPQLKQKGKMVGCEVCGVFLAPDNAFEVRPGHYRCDEHRHDN